MSVHSHLCFVFRDIPIQSEIRYICFIKLWNHPMSYLICFGSLVLNRLPTKISNVLMPVWLSGYHLSAANLPFFVVDSMRLRPGLSKFSFSFASWLYVRLCQWRYQRETKSLDKRKELTFLFACCYCQGLRSNGSLLRQQWLVPVFSFFLFLFVFSAQPDPALLYPSEVSIRAKRHLLKGLSPSSAEVSLWTSMAPGRQAALPC